MGKKPNQPTFGWIFLALSLLLFLAACSLGKPPLGVIEMSEASPTIETVIVGVATEEPPATDNPKPTESLKAQSDTPKPTETEVNKFQQWARTIELDDNGNAKEYIELAAGERFEALGNDALINNNTLMVLDKETNIWVETAHINSVDELLEKVPSLDQMKEFLYSDEIVRSLYSDGTTNLLGVSKLINHEVFGERLCLIDSIVWGLPELVWVDLASGEKIVVHVLPVVTTADKENTDNPVFIWLVLGKERVTWTGIRSNPLNIVVPDEESRKAQNFRSYIVEIDTFSNVFVRGRQLRNMIFIDLWDSSKEREYRKLDHPQAVINLQLLDELKHVTSDTINKLISGGKVNQGVIIGRADDFIQVNTTITDKDLTEPIP